METRSPVFPSTRVGSFASAPATERAIPAKAAVLCRNSRRELSISAPLLEFRIACDVAPHWAQRELYWFRSHPMFEARSVMPRQITTAPDAHGRRDFLKVLGGGALASALAFNRLSAAAKPGSKPIRGLFPIGSSPFTDSDKLDLECLAAEVKFLNRGGVHGVIWPQIASEWTSLSKQERLDGAEAMVAAGKGGKTAITIGVQGPDMATVLEYTKHADKIGADALCSLPPANVTDENALFDYYKAIGTASDLPLFVQSQPLVIKSLPI